MILESKEEFYKFYKENKYVTKKQVDNLFNAQKNMLKEKGFLFATNALPMFFQKRK